MLKTMRCRKGVTLAEIVVVLALVVIMISMAVSFALLITARTKANAANDAMRRDCEMIRSTAERWMDAVAEMDVSADGATVTAGTSSLAFRYGSLVGKTPDGKSQTIRTESVTSVAFEVMQSDADRLLFCHVTCKNPETDESFVFTVCVNSRLGENGGGAHD